MADEVISPSDVIRHLRVGTGSPVTNGFLPIELEALSHQADWEGQIESLELKEEQLQQEQLKLIRQQITTNLRELGLLRDDVIALANKTATIEVNFGQTAKVNESMKSVMDRLKFLEELSAETSEDSKKHARTYADRLVYLEKFLGDSDSKHFKQIDDLKSAHRTHEQGLDDLKFSQGSYASLPGRIEQLELSIGTLADQHMKELRAFTDAHSKRIEALEASLGHSSERSAHELQRALADIRDCQATMDGRVDFVEKMLGEASDRHVRDLQAVKDANSKLSAAQLLQGKELESVRDLPLSLPALRERLDSFERMFSEAADMRVSELQSVRDVQSRHSKDLGALNASRLQTMTAVERLASLEKQLGELQERQGDEAQEWKLALARQEETLNRSVKDLAKSSSSLDRFARELQVVKDECDRNGRGLQDAGGQQIAVEERLKYMEKFFGDSADKHSKELKALKLAFDKQFADMAGMRTASALQGALPERIDNVEQMVADIVDKHAKDLQALRDALAKLMANPGKFDRDFEELRTLFSQHAGMGDRLAYLEQLLRDHAFFALLPDRLNFLEQRVGDMAEKPKEVEVVRPVSPPRSPPAVMRSLSDFDSLKALQASVAQRVASVNDRKNIHYDPRTRRATFLLELALKKRHFGSNHVDEPSAEWCDEGAVQPMFVDVTFLFEIFTTAAQEQHRENRVTVTVVRCRNRNAKRASDLVRHSLTSSQHSGSPPPAKLATSSSMLDRAQSWEMQLALNRAQLIADSLVAHGVPKTSIVAKVDSGLQDGYFVEFQFHFGGGGGGGGLDSTLSVGSGETRPSHIEYGETR